MATPKFYYANLLAKGTLSGSSSDEANPVRRVSDSDRTLRYTLLDAVGPDVTTGQVETTLAAGDTRTHFVMVSGVALSGWTLNIESEDVGGGNNATHLDTLLLNDQPLVAALSGVSTARRVWRVKLTSTSGITTSPQIYEMMLAKQYEVPSGYLPLVGVARATVQNYQSLQVPGSASFKFRLGEDYERVAYSFVMPRAQVSGIKSFLQENDGGEPFWHIDDQGRGYWAELGAQEIAYDDQAGVYAFEISVQEIPQGS